MDQGDIGLDEELATRKPATLKTSGLGPFSPSDGDPYVALLLGERAPAFGDRGENPADRALRRAAGVVRDKRRIGVLAKPIALPDYIPAFSRLGNIKSLHNRSAGAALSRPGILPDDHAIWQTAAEPEGNATANGFQDSIGGLRDFGESAKR
jgi:hypothetical protein